MNKFWNWIRDEDTGERILRLEGPVDEDDFWGDSVTPKAFRDELEAEDGDITVWINSPGGSVFAAAEIYTMLLEYKGAVTVKIASIAASAASVIAMAGDTVLMSPTAMLMCHDPMTIAMGNAKDLEKAISTLNEVKESIINAYQHKTGLSRNKIAKIMEDETWMNAKKAVQLGFADAVLFEGEKKDPDTSEEEMEEEADESTIEAKDQEEAGLYSTRTMGRKVLNRLCAGSFTAFTEEADGTDVSSQEDVVQAEEGITNPDIGENHDTESIDLEEGQCSAENEDAAHRETAEAFVYVSLVEALDSFSKSITESVVSEVTAVLKEAAREPQIDNSGKTPEGAVPYEILKKQLDFLR